MNIHTLLEKTGLFFIIALIPASILLLVPITENFIEHTKLYTLLFSSLVVLLLFIVKSFFEKSVRISISPATGGLFFLGLTTLAATLFTATYPVEGLLGLGGMFIGMSIIGLFGANLLPHKANEWFLYALTTSSVVLTLATIAQLLGFGPAQIMNSLFSLELPTTLLFNLAGSSFIALQICALTLITLITHIVTLKKVPRFFAFSLPIIIIGTGIFAWSLLPGKETSLQLPSYSTGWSVMLDTLKSPKSALIGAGTHAYKNVFQSFKPLWLNGTAGWSNSYTQAGSSLLTIITTMGVLGFFAWVWIVLKQFSFHKNVLLQNKSLSIFIILNFVIGFFLPLNAAMITLQAVAFACLIAAEKNKLTLLELHALTFKLLNKPETLSAQKKNSPLIAYPLTLAALFGVLFLGYALTRSLQAQVVMAQSTEALGKNDVVAAYELQQKAVTLNPYSDVFRRRFSETSALIAIALSNKADITDQEKQQVSQLLQQSVTQARAATTLDEGESQNWSNLARIYNNLIEISEDAFQWTVQSYVSAIQTYPSDPVLRLEMANLFAAQKDYNRAIGLIDQAIELKADLPASYFQKAQILELIKTPEALQMARSAYQTTLLLLNPSSEDYVTVTQKLEALEAYMKENNIPLEPAEPATGEATSGESAGATQTNGGTAPTGENAPEAQQESSLLQEQTQLPLITEQNIENTDTVNPENTEFVQLEN